MADYTKATNFAAKDSLATGNPLKIVVGTDIDTEFNAIQAAVNSKSDKTSPTFIGTVTIPTLVVSGTATIGTINGGTF
jgi:hypothetical protein